MFADAAVEMTIAALNNSDAIFMIDSFRTCGRPEKRFAGTLLKAAAGPAAHAAHGMAIWYSPSISTSAERTGPSLTFRA